MTTIEKSLELFKKFLEEEKEEVVLKFFQEVNENRDGGMPVEEYLSFVESQLEVNMLFGFNSNDWSSLLTLRADLISAVKIKSENSFDTNTVNTSYAMAA